MLKLLFIFLFFGLTFQTFAQTWQQFDSLGRVFLKEQKFQQADSVYRQALIFVEKTKGKQDSTYAKVNRRIGILYYYQGLLDKVEYYFMEAKNINAVAFGKKHPTYANSCIALGILYDEQGLYLKAESFYLEAKVIFENTIGKENSDYANLSSNLAVLYYKQGMYEKAETFYLDGLVLKEKLTGKDNVEYVGFCNNLATLYDEQGLYDKAEPIFIIAKDGYEKYLGKKSIEYAMACSNLGALYFNKAQYEKSEAFNLEALKIREEIFGKIHNEYAVSCNNLGELYQRLGKYSQAEPLFLESLKIREEKLGKEHPEYAFSCNKLALMYQNQGLFEKSAPLFEEVMHNKFAQIRAFFPAFAEKEKQAYYNTIADLLHNIVDFAIDSQEKHKSVLSLLYTQQLFTKGIIFSSSQKMRQQILASGDTALVNHFQFWKNQKDTYIQALQTSRENREKAGVDLKKMEAEITNLERELSLKSELFAQNNNKKEYKWQDVKSKLGINEVAIEMIRAEQSIGWDSLGREKKDTVYAALIITDKTTTQPEFLLLKNGGDLERKFLIYYKNATTFYVDDNISYNHFWKPIADKLKAMGLGVKTQIAKIYFAPDGIYHQISLNALKNPQTGKFVFDEQNILIIGSSRDLIEMTKIEKDLSKNFAGYQAYMLGFPTYRLYSKADTLKGSERTATFNGLKRVVCGVGKLELLPGTKNEIENINRFFTEKKIPTNTFLKENANEANIKSLKSPTILHIATHGFFVPEIKASKVKTVLDAENRKLLTNPFMRAGLLLAGCETPNQDGEDGILTAEEAMNLNLDKTELVVLSACETGLGDIQNGEGVFGLQRAFQQAGAKTVLMSLWKVSDTATQMLMTEFYSALMSGKNKHDAFKVAQFKLREKYPSPYFWGAFVMIGR